MTERAYSKSYIFLIYLVLAVSTFFAYELVRHNDFIDMDDPPYVTENPHVKKGITRESVIWAFTTPHGDTSYWHPLTWLSHMLDCELFGLNSGYHHLTSLFLHIANTLLLFFVLKRMTSAVWRSFFVAAIFALHPLHVESVAWVAERKDVLSSFFWMLTMIAYVRYTEQPGIVRYLLVVLVFSLGMMSKPMIVTLPFVLLLLDYWPLGRFQFGHAGKSIKRRRHDSESNHFRWPVFYRLVWEKIPLFILSAILGVVTFIAQRSSGAVTSMSGLPPMVRVANAVISYVKYIGKMFWPSQLAIFYPHPCETIPTWQITISSVLLLVITIFVIRLARKHKYLLVGWLWYIGMLVPVIGLIQVGSQAMADRYTYLPLIGIFIIVAWGAAELGARWRFGRIWLGISMGIVLAILLVCTRIQVRHWQDSFTLYGHAIEVTENNRRMHNNYGAILYRKGEFDEAITHFKEALRIDPLFSKAHNNMGLAFKSQGKINEAIACFREALRLEPTYADALNHLGIALEEQGKIDEAIRCYEKAVQNNPDSFRAYSNIAIAKLKQKKYDQAIKYFSKALSIKPDWPEVCAKLGETYLLVGNISQTIKYWHKALELSPENVDVLNNLAWFKATIRQNGCYNPKEAVQLAKRACELTGYNRADFMDTLAVAYAAVGNFPEAIKTAEEAIKLAEAAGETDLTKEIQGRLELYKLGQPYRGE